MTTGTATAQEEKSFTQILAERDTALLDVNLTLEEFAERIELSYDDRWRRHSWRVNGDIYLYHWIYDHHQKRDEEMLTDAAVIECAYERFRAIQDRRGQVNFHSVYVKDCENVELFPRKNLDHATVRVVRDRIDRLYRYSTSYHAVNGGGSSSPSFYSPITANRTDALLAGAKEMLETLTSGWEAKSEPEKYNPFINRIRHYIENLKDEIRQPSLFG